VSRSRGSRTGTAGSVSVRGAWSAPGTLQALLPKVAAGCDVLLGPYSTQLARIAGKMAAAAGWLVWNHGGSGDDVQALCRGHAVSLPTPASLYAGRFIRDVLEGAGLELWIVQGKGSFGRQVADGAQQIAEQAGASTRRFGTGDAWPCPPGLWALVSAGTFEDDVQAVNRFGRPVRFIMDRTIYSTPFLNLIFRGMKAVPITSAKDDPAALEQAFEIVARELSDGQLVCIFPEGRLTTDGEIGPFRPGLTRILNETPVPVVPIGLSGLWGSMFSRQTRTIWMRLPRKLFARITIIAGTPVPPEEATPDLLRERVLALRGSGLARA